jgi:dihydroflavonol-4-reductase
VKILVTGGSGFLGAHLVPLLAQQGHSVRVLGRRPLPPSLPAEWLQGDLLERDSVRAAIASVDAIYHLAGLVSFKPVDARRMYELHVDGTRELLREVQALGTKPRIILASTSGTIAVSKDERVGTEADDYPITVVGRWPYYLSKIYEEKLALSFCQEHQLPLVVLNPSLLMGPGDDRLSSTWTVVKFLNREIPAMPGGGLSFVDARDAAKAFAAALTRGELYGRHLMGVNMKLSDFFARLERISGVPAPRVKLPSRANVLGAMLLSKLADARGTTPALDPQEVDIGEHYFYLDAAKAEAELGFSARDPQETLFDTVQYVLSKLPPQSLPGTKGRLAELRK